MSAHPCGTCGAIRPGLVCAYCGAREGDGAAQRDELAAVEELHRRLATEPKEAAIHLVKMAFLPHEPTALLEAGLRLVPMLGDANTQDALANAAMERLDAVLIKLRVAAPDEQVRRALPELEARLARHRSSVARENRMFAWLFGTIAVLLVGGCGALIVRGCG